MTKKIVIGALLAVSVIGLVGCASKKEVAKKTESSAMIVEKDDARKDIGYPKNFLGTYQTSDGQELVIWDQNGLVFGKYTKVTSEDVTSSETVDTAHGVESVEGEFGDVKHIEKDLYQLDYSTAVGLTGVSMGDLPNDVRAKVHDQMQSGKKGLAELVLAGFKFDSDKGQYQVVIYVKDDKGAVDYDHPDVEGPIFERKS